MKFSRLIFANLFRKKVRLILTIGSFAVALFLFAFLAVVKGAFGRGADVAGADRLVVINRISIIQPLPLSYRDKILRIPGVKAITHNNWFGGVYQDEKNFFPQFAIDIENQRKVFPEFVVPDDQWRQLRQGSPGRHRRRENRRALRLENRRPHPHQEHHLRPTPALGNSISTASITMTVPGGDESQFWFQWKYFRRERAAHHSRAMIGWYILRLDNPDDALRVAKAIDDMFANSRFRNQNRNRIRLSPPAGSNSSATSNS